MVQSQSHLRENHEGFKLASEVQQGGIWQNEGTLLLFSLGGA